MEWCKLYATFADDPKVRNLSDKAFRRYVEAMCYATLHETDGWAPMPSDRKTTAELVEAGLRDEDGVIHGWLNRQRSAEQLANERRTARMRSRERRQNVERSSSTEVEEEVEVENQDQELPAAPVAKLRNTLADALLAPDSRSMYFRAKLIERDAARWIVLSPAAVMKLGKQFGAEVVIEALSYVYEQPDSAEDAYPYLLTICRRIEERGVA